MRIFHHKWGVERNCLPFVKWCQPSCCSTNIGVRLRTFLPLMRLTKFIIDDKMSISQFFKETRCDSKRQTIFGGSIFRVDFICLIFIRYTHLKQSDYFYNLTITTKGNTKTYLYSNSKKKYSTKLAELKSVPT